VFIYTHIQDDSGGRSIFDLMSVVSVTVKKRKARMNMYLILNGYQDGAVLINRHKSMVTQKQKLLAVNEILILFSRDKCRSVKFVTVHNKYSKIPPSTSIQFATRERKTRVASQS
jgi:hypothetical protein